MTAKPALTEEEFVAFLRDLASSGVVRVIGSYARGTQNQGDHLSDLDLYVLRGQAGLKKVIAIYEKHGVKWGSHVLGAIHSPRVPFYMPFPVEASYFYDCDRRKTFKLEVYGVEFDAYEQTTPQKPKEGQ